MPKEDKSKDPNDFPKQEEAVAGVSLEYQAGRRSITNRGGVTRRQMVAEKQQLQIKSRPFIIAAIVVLFGILTIPVYAYFQNYVFPPRELALRAVSYTHLRAHET